MSFVQDRLVTFKYVLLIIFLHNYVCQCNSLDVISESTLASILEKVNVSQNLVGLPKNLVLTEEKISENTNLYLIGKQNEDIYLNGTQLIQKYGYKVEEHHVTTSDGYELALIRIPGNGKVVFLMHGLANSFVDWLTVGPDQGLPYLLANLGYDVWMGNARGNTYSRKHKYLSPSSAEFWNFSFHEIGVIDLPTMIDYVLAITGKQKTTYIGHSQGTTVGFILCSVKPEYNDKIDFMVALSAVAWMKNIPNPILRIAAQSHVVLYAVGRALGVNEIAADNDLKKIFSATFCGTSLLAYIICQNAMFLLAGFNYSQANYKQLPVIYNHTPSGCSLKQIEHFAQLIKSGYFRNYDHGLIQNEKKYGSAIPPSYPVENITVPIAIFYSHGDWLASPIDVEKLRSKLKNVVYYYEPLPDFNHIDFIWAKDVKELVYDKVLNLIEEY